MKEALIKFLIFLDGSIYDLITYIYEIFLGLAKMNLFSNSQYEEIVNRIYVILGTVMLFFLAYALLRAVINPDEFAKGEMSFPKLIKNVLTSLVIIALLPTIFTYAFNLQNAILNNNTITKIVLGTNERADEVKAEAGREMAFYMYSAFVYPEPAFCAANNISDYESCRASIRGNGTWFTTNGGPLTDLDDKVLHNNVSFRSYSMYSEAIRDNDLHYSYLITTIASLFVLYILANFCFDLALRVIKLMFYQIIAPIAVICRVIPTGKMKDVFNNWLKATLGTFLEVFIRVLIMTLAVYMIHIITSKEVWESVFAVSLPGVQGLIARALIIMGLVMFIKSAPKLITDIFGIGNIKLGLKDKLAEGGFFTAGAAVGAAGGMFARNAVHAYQNVKKGQSGVLRGIGSTLAGTASGFFRGGYNARNAKSQADARNAMASSVQRATLNRSNRERYRAQHAGDSALPAGFNVFGAHISDNFKNATEWAGIGADLDALNAQKKFNSQIIAIDDNSDSVAGELMNRDGINNSVSLMKAVSEVSKNDAGVIERQYSMSLQAMRERAQMLKNDPNGAKNLKFIQVGSDHIATVKDFLGNSIQINQANLENEYAQYLATMNAQLGQAERDMKKYIKLRGYEGAAGSATVEGLVKGDGLSFGGGEKQRFDKLASDAENVANLVAANQNSISETNKGARKPSDVVTSVKSYTDMDNITNNAKNSNININATIERMTREKEARNPGDKK